jgi:hypothetical protein
VKRKTAGRKIYRKVLRSRKKDRSVLWSPEEVENFKKNWPHQKNFSDSVIKHATLSELTAMGRQKFSGNRLLSQVLTSNFEQVQNFPEKVKEGLDSCTGKAYSARFLRGYAGDSQELWKQARETWGVNGIDPISNYEVVSIGLQDLLTPVAWSELHKPNSRRLSIRMLSSNSVDDTWKGGGRRLTLGRISRPCRSSE